MMLFELEAFTGPLDLLFQLIKKNEIDIYNIPIAKVTEQYLAAIKTMPPDMDGMSEFLVMAATLLEIKSRMLLPKNKNEIEEEEDPQERLIQQLIAYKHTQELADQLKEIKDAGRRVFKEPEHLIIEKAEPYNPSDWLKNISTDKLLEIFTDVLQKQVLKIDNVRQNFGTVSKEVHTISDKIKLIAKYLKEKGSFYMSDLFIECKSKEECVVTFLALLEMIRRNQANLFQKNVFEEIEVLLPCQTYK